MHLNFVDPTIEIFRYFQVSVLRPIPKIENLEILGILQQRQNTGI